MNDIEEWLETPEARSLLDAAARSVVQAVRQRSLPIHLVTGKFSKIQDQASLLEDIRSELVLFILEDKRSIQKHLIAGGKNPGQMLKSLFINHLIDRARTPEEDPQRYLYKRATNVLRDSSRFGTQAQKNRPMVFSMEPNSGETLPLTTEDLEEIPYSDSTLTFEEVNHEAALLRLAERFWLEVKRMWGDGPVWVRISDFIGWVGLHVDLKQPMVSEERVGESDLISTVADDGPGPERSWFDHARIVEWAGKFAARLKAKEKAALWMHHDQGLPLEQIAEKLGYSGPSGASYPLARAEEKLRFFLRDLDWLSPEDENREAMALFLETLFSLLKKDASVT